MRGTGPVAFEAYFGPVTRDNAYGEFLWQGMRAHLREFRASGCRGSPALSNGPLLLGWFACPKPFGRHGAGLSVQLRGSGHWCPAVFTMEGFDQQRQLLAMWCQNILAMRSRLWWVHISRVRFTDVGVESMNFRLTEEVWTVANSLQ